MTTDLPRVTHFGPIVIGDITLDAAVLANGNRGYIQKQLARAIGFSDQFRGAQGRRFLKEIAPNALKLLIETGVPKVLLPHGGWASFAPVGILTEIVSGVIEAGCAGKLHHKQLHILPRCMAILKALAKTGEAALIDEATGYQYHRAPDALQDIFAKLLRQSASDWERRFHPDFYEAIYRLFNWAYNPAKPKPYIIGRITLEWVYEPVFPTEILIEIKERQGSEKMHQWLQEGGLTLLEKQRDAVMMIARSSVDYRDFENRCAVAFFRRGQMPILYPREAA
ncbi:MAG TPA: P63C domain-containing protein [Candidatus Competibacteraceae bacterium]|nr:P63C domain-containing protein [Candidatus Competibacteraceae bacterium]